jgi:ribonucleoside-diphosphate reductase alpha chain
MTQFMMDMGIPNEPDVTKPLETTVFSFPTVTPKSAMVRDDMTAIDQLNIWLIYQNYWCEHKPSVTISVRKDEWMDVGAWVYEHFDDVSGISFLPHSEHVYKQAPYQEVNKETCLEMVARMPTKIDWSKLSDYEKEDGTTGARDLACSAGVCEVVDLTN